MFFVLDDFLLKILPWKREVGRIPNNTNLPLVEIIRESNGGFVSEKIPTGPGSTYPGTPKLQI